MLCYVYYQVFQMIFNMILFLQFYFIINRFYLCIYGCIKSIDIKKIIAYSSIAHMNFSLLGMFSFNILGLAGMIYLMFGHAVTSGALFLGVGLLYDRYKTRLIFYYGSLVILCLFFQYYILFYIIKLWISRFFYFVGEFLILLGAFDFSMLQFFYLLSGWCYR